MSDRGSIVSFLSQLGLGAEFVRDTTEVRPLAEAFALREGLDPVALAELIERAFVEGNTASFDGRVACLRVPDGVVVALRDPALATTLHEVRNAITAVAGWARIARQEGGATARADKALVAIEAAALVAMDAAAAGTTRPSDAPISEEPLPKARPLSVGALLSQALSLVEPMARERNVALRESAPPDLRVALTRGELLSAISNLLKNAIEACHPGDEVAVGAMRVLDTIEIEVTNPSHGAPLPSVGRSSKGTGRGIGLRVVSNVAKKGGGELLFEGRADTMVARLRLPEAAPNETRDRRAQVGSIERVVRPRVRGPALASGTRLAARGFDRESDDATGPIALAGSPGSVLVMDDEHAIRDLVTTALGLSGISALGASGPEDLATEPHRTFELALVDLRLGDRDGLAVARQLVKDGWARRVVIMTGAPLGTKPADVLAVVRKPFDLDELTESVTLWATPNTTPGLAPRARRTR
jgi:signal transduction histidine kinase